MGKLYTAVASLFALMEIGDFINLSFLGAHPAIPTNSLSSYNDLSLDVKDTFIMLASWVGLAKLYMGFFSLGTAMSSEPEVRIVGAMGACFASCASFASMIPAAKKVATHETTNIDVEGLMTIPIGLVLGPIFGLAAYMEYREMMQQNSDKNGRTKKL